MQGYNRWKVRLMVGNGNAINLGAAETRTQAEKIARCAATESHIVQVGSTIIIEDDEWVCDNVVGEVVEYRGGRVWRKV